MMQLRCMKSARSSAAQKATRLHDATMALLGGAIAVVLARNFFESEKKVTEAIAVDYGPDDPQFTRTSDTSAGHDGIAC
jgi:hypothetical protein